MGWSQRTRNADFAEGTSSAIRLRRVLPLDRLASEGKDGRAGWRVRLMRFFEMAGNAPLEGITE
jgi:hypothetical protein